MVRKRIELNSGRCFETIAEARKFFDQILQSTELNSDVSDDEFRELSALYEAYCAKTNWQVSSPPVAFFPKHESGPGYTTKCFGVRFQDGATDRFSLDKALSAVAIGATP
ncbi:MULTISPECIES: hypothetical protein [Bradyrhizobium]|uniref:Uncharacterized protein n=1 Tax=Bradyrhizobium ottawaense TaxID=931866 RepID=A0ABV4FNP6_9BRAD|nr:MULTISPECIES: hypothetical protein [Bradyrhizobium]MBR1293546.1 hypothetical protein [Bradyrhizobium ottawaense]WLB45842.1 hypothetical protein QIH93_36080 [Bradyrhizobium ottawaense]GMO15259.1 hypothetical protein BwSH14_03950 [Bradyrhizobium ottawaense]GMO18220.1 hypothetical protein BwSF21_10260 [Bradyrhizobium ottawaense]GMO45678.1 hypothetical protein BwSF12_51320 [Bradyrhizobium ottawaense]